MDVKLSLNDLEARLEDDVEKEIFQDLEFQAGLRYGKPRRGHPEGEIVYHIHDVLDNIDRFYQKSEYRSDLRLITLVHDTFKYKVDRSKSKVGQNHHGMIARKFAEQYLPPDSILLDIIELHDEAYNAWNQGDRKNQWDKAEVRLVNLLQRIEGVTEVYQMFYRCDNATGDKSHDCYEWFVSRLEKV